jgi:hypothetical protein
MNVKATALSRLEQDGRIRRIRDDRTGMTVAVTLDDEVFAFDGPGGPLGAMEAVVDRAKVRLREVFPNAKIEGFDRAYVEQTEFLRGRSLLTDRAVLHFTAADAAVLAAKGPTYQGVVHGFEIYITGPDGGQ